MEFMAATILSPMPAAPMETYQPVPITELLSSPWALLHKAATV